MITIPSFRLGQISTAVFALCFAGLGTAQTKLDPPVKPAVTGKFIGNGKSAVLKFVIVEERDPFGDENAIGLLFTEKDPSKSKKPSFDAMFGELGSALNLSMNYEGAIFGCEVAHSAHEKKEFTSLGRIKMTEFKIAGGNVTGHVSTGGELDTFGEKWEVDLIFAAPLPEKLRNAPAAPPKKAVAKDAGEDDADEPAEPKAPASPVISAHKLPIPKDATDVEFKELVKMIQFSSPQPVAAVTKEISASLKQQGWKDGAGSLEGKTNSILKREQGAANLTIMIQPAGAGSVVKFMTEGLDWSGGDDTAPSPPKKAAKEVKDAEDATEDIEADVQKQLDEALKGLPK
ncbi:MAG: hypothetical protein ABIS50_19475 [Luteolibacter sp.]|uniref:hypothetical protein n=1 Tax=Luteolibacter sp. TaxID=1962973 RepID=UPI0032633B27